MNESNIWDIKALTKQLKYMQGNDIKENIDNDNWNISKREMVNVGKSWKKQDESEKERVKWKKARNQ